MNELERYRDGLRALDEALAGADLDTTSAGWTPRQIVHHLADLSIVNAARLRRLVAEDDPLIPDVDEERYAKTLHYERSTDASLALLRACVASNIDLLASLDETELVRRGTHEAFGEYSISYWLERQVNHLHEHAEQIAACRR